MHFVRALSLTTLLLCTVLLFTVSAVAQESPNGEPPAGVPADEDDDESPGEGPAEASTAVVMDDAEALEDAQREAEDETEAPPTAVAPPEAERTPGAATIDYGHAGQFGVRVGVAVPYVFAIKYGDGPSCGDDPEETFCRRLGAGSLDLGASYAVTDTLEIDALLQIGLADDEAADARPFALGLGIRAYTASEPMLKAYIGARAMLDLTSSNVAEWRDLDVGLRGEVGLQLDVLRYAGLYLQLAETIRVLRSLYFVSDVSAGVQVRFP